METFMVQQSTGKMRIIYGVCLFLAAIFVSCVQAAQWVNLSPESGDQKNIPPKLERLIIDEKNQPRTTRVTYEVFSFLKTPQRVKEDMYHTIFIEGCGPYPKIGKPDVPVKIFFFDLPKDSNWSVSVVDTDTAVIKDINLMPVQELPMDSIQGEAPVFEKDKTVYAEDSLFPAMSLLGMKTVRVRDKKMLEVRVSPVRFNPVKKTAVIIKKIEFEVTFTPLP